MSRNSEDGYRFNGSGDGGFDAFSEDDSEEEHEHIYTEIASTPNHTAYEEMVHQVVSIEFHDRGLTLEFSYEEAEELAQLLTEINGYLQRKRTLDQ